MRFCAWVALAALVWEAVAHAATLPLSLCAEEGLPPAYRIKKLGSAHSCPKGYSLRRRQQQQQQQQWVCVPSWCPEAAAAAGAAAAGAAAAGAAAGAEEGSSHPQLPGPTGMQPRPGWMAEHSSKRLHQLFLPGSHDSGTYRWTVPTQSMPFVIGGLATMVINLFEDLSGTQRLTVYEQLQAGARVLDFRLAVNPWLALAARDPQLLKQAAAAAIAAGAGAGATAGAAVQPLFSFDPAHLQGSLNLAAAGGSLSDSEVASSLVLSHSVPAAPLREALQDLHRFLSEQPTEVVLVLVKGDSVDVNPAGISRMSPQAWASAAQMFREELPGVALLSQDQVQQQTLRQLQAAATKGSLVLYSRELQQQGLNALCSKQLPIIESWGNGTNAEEVPDLLDKLVGWMEAWKEAGWQHNSSPTLLLASAEVTLGVQGILELIWDHWLEGKGARPQLLWGMAQQELRERYETLYGLGAAANQQALERVFLNTQVAKTFNIWSMDALSDDLLTAIIGLNKPDPLPPSYRMTAT